MLFAYDHNDEKIHISNTHSNQEYYCPYCGEPLTTRRQSIRACAHFAHRPKSVCSDYWERAHQYDTSAWHNEWQSLFPKENQEVKLRFGDTVHRADIMIDRAVIEFQHSIISAQAFADRNNFYLNLGNKVIWLFDLSDLMEERITYKVSENKIEFLWDYPKKAFNSHDLQSGTIDLFFQINEGPDACIVRVIEVSEYGFEKFYTTNLMSKNEFLSYVGLNDNGECLPPWREDVEKSEQYYAFKDKYNIRLTRQQERALLATEGANLLLAVPGSGKTTVLVSRLGHMVLNKNIAPESILAITFGKNADNEMRERFSAIFGEELGKKIEFRTINSLALKIYSNYCDEQKKPKRTLITSSERKQIVREILKRYLDGFAESDIQELLTAITCIKNLEWEDHQIAEAEIAIPDLRKMYCEYQAILDEKQLMDFDDQLVYARALLTKRPQVAQAWQSKYKYICVDEAQDTSKIQHAIIQILAKGNNIFMVGDEDQSIYGFRGAYPRALLNFRFDYTNPYVLRMEQNYRSTTQIVEKAQSFISVNTGRYKKRMTAERGDGNPVELERVDSTESQYMRLLEVAKNATNQTAFLYRDNESSVVLVDLFLRNNISFTLRKPEMNFFGNRIVKEIVAYLKLSLNEYDIASFKQICNRGILYLEAQQRDYAIKFCRDKHMTIYDAVDTQMPYVKEKYRDRADNFRSVMHAVSVATSYDAICILIEHGFGNYVKKQSLDTGKLNILKTLAKQEADKQKFLDRLIELEKLISQGFQSETDAAVVLSTIHSSKGLEYNNVYMVDVYDGRFPSSRPNIFTRSKDAVNGEQEERRLFYVGITRAKNNLHLFSIKGKDSTFIEQMFPGQVSIFLKEEEKQRKALEEQKIEVEVLESQQNPVVVQTQQIHVLQEQNIIPNIAMDITETEEYSNDQNNCSSPEIGMKLYHKNYGALTITEVDRKPNKTIIYVVDSKGERSSKNWEILWRQGLVRIINN